MIFVGQSAVPLCTAGRVASFEDESSRPGLPRTAFTQVFQQRLLDVVALGDDDPVAGIGQTIDSRLGRRKAAHSRCVEGPRHHLVKRQQKLV